MFTRTMFTRTGTFALLSALCGALGGMPSAAPARAADAALIAAAQKEGQVTWYTTQITNQFGRPAMDAFQKRYGIRVNFVRADSIELAARMLNEAQAGRLQADVFDGTATAPVVKRAGLALKWLPERARLWPPEYRDAEEFWVATNLFVHTPAYNTNLVPKGSEPRRLNDLLDPKWKRKMAWAIHATSSGALGFIGVVLAEMGETSGKAYLRELARQDIIGLGGSARTVVDQAIAGEFPLVLQAFNHQPVISARLGAPIDWIPMSPAMAVLSVAGVTKDAPHPNAGKLLVDFFVSDEDRNCSATPTTFRPPPKFRRASRRYGRTERASAPSSFRPSSPTPPCRTGWRCTTRYFAERTAHGDVAQSTDLPLVPAKAGTQSSREENWIPACAGMSE